MSRTLNIVNLSLLTASLLAGAGCNVVSQKADQPQASSSDKAVQSKTGDVLAMASNAVQLVDRVAVAINDATGKGGNPTKTPYGAIEQIISQSGVGQITHLAGGQYSYRAQSQGLQKKGVTAFLTILGHEDKSNVTIDACNIEIGNTSAPQAFALLTSSVTAKGTDYTLNFSAMTQLAKYLKADNASYEVLIDGDLDLISISGESRLTGTGLSIVSPDYAISINRLDAVSKVGSADLTSLIIDASYYLGDSASGGAGVVGELHINTNEVKSDDLGITLKAKFQGPAPVVAPSPTPSPSADPTPAPTPDASQDVGSDTP